MLTYVIATLALLGVIVRPWRSREVWWACAGALVLTLSGLLPWQQAASAIAKGSDVYLFLTGMMLLSALAEREGLFDYLAALCVRQARGSASRLFLMVYTVGIIITVFMSNDATAVVLTPAVLAVCHKAKAPPLPYLFACALIANAASFVLPISNPANLVIYGSQLPALSEWLSTFLLPSVLAIAVTFAVLRVLGRADLSTVIQTQVTVPVLSASGHLAAAAVVTSAIVLMLSSAINTELGAPALAVSTGAWLIIAFTKSEAPWKVLSEISWSIVPLVAGLFIIVEGLQSVGFLELLRTQLHALPGSTTSIAMTVGIVVAIACNLMNNLPAGLIAGSVVVGAGLSPVIHSAVVIGIDLGPNLSVTGSLATILWLAVLRKHGIHVSAWRFFKTGIVAMPLALAAALCGLWIQNLP